MARLALQLQEIKVIHKCLTIHLMNSNMRKKITQILVNKCKKNQENKLKKNQVNKRKTLMLPKKDQLRIPKMNQLRKSKKNK